MIRYSRACGYYQDFLDRRLLLTRKLQNQVVVATMTWLTVMQYLYHKWPRIRSICRKHFPILSSFMTAHRFVTKLIRRVPLVVKELLSLPEHLSSTPVFSGVRVTRSLVLCACFVDRCLSFCTFSFAHGVFCSSIYGLPLWYIQTLHIILTRVSI